MKINVSRALKLRGCCAILGKRARKSRVGFPVPIFNWKTLKRYLKQDEANKESSNDFGKDIIPSMLDDGNKMMAYPFKGYWKDVGTIDSLWQANMDLLKENNELNLHDEEWKIYSVNPVRPAQYIGESGEVTNSLIVEGCIVNGKVENSVLFQGVQVGKNTVIRDSVIMTNAKIGDNVVIEKAIVGSNAIIRKDCKIDLDGEIAVVASKEEVKMGTVIQNNKAV